MWPARSAPWTPLVGDKDPGEAFAEPSEGSAGWGWGQELPLPGERRCFLASLCLTGASSFETVTALPLIMHLFIHVWRPTICKENKSSWGRRRETDQQMGSPNPEWLVQQEK